MKHLIFYIALILSFSLNAHQPKIINYSPSIDDPHEVINPEISKAYYGKLTGKPHYYVIRNEEDFLFYTSILSPKVNDNYTWLSIEVLDENIEGSLLRNNLARAIAFEEILNFENHGQHESFLKFYSTINNYISNILCIKNNVTTRNSITLDFISMYRYINGYII